MCDSFTLNPAYQRSKSNPDSKFELFSDRHMRCYPDYTVDYEGRVVPKAEAKKINIDEL